MSHYACEPLVSDNQESSPSSSSIMGQETNIELIRSLDKQISEGSGDILKLKRTRNSLLNISTRVPPEILGSIFVQTLVWQTHHEYPRADLHFEGFLPNPYNFLLVCYYWFEVASHTPQLWNFWGNTLREWGKKHHYSGALPIDLVFNAYEQGPRTISDGSLRDTLRDQARNDNLRQVHLLGWNPLLSTVISLLTPDDEAIQCRSIESIDIQNQGPVTDLSLFFVRTHLPKLRSLILRGMWKMPPWDSLVPQTTLLTTLSLNLSRNSPTIPPTTAQILSILVSNPGIEDLSLKHRAVPDCDDSSSLQVPLCRLKRLCLKGNFHRVFGLFGRLTFPDALDAAELVVLDSRIDDVPRVSHQLRKIFQQAHGSLDNPSIGACVYFGDVDVFVVAESDPPRWVRFKLCPVANTPQELAVGLGLNLVALTPREHALYFETNLPANRLEDHFMAMPKLEKLRLETIALTEGLLQPNPSGPHAEKKLFPSLRDLELKHVTLEDNGDWNHLKTYLIHQTSGGQAIKFGIRGSVPPLSPEVAKEIESLVEEFARG